MKKVWLTGFLSLILVSAIYSQKADTTAYQSLEPYEFHLEYLKTDPAMMVDVREPFEFRGRRIKDAINIPSSGNFETAADTLDKNYAMFFYCTSGYRSKRVAAYFAGKGFTRVYSLEGGIVAWKKEGFPLVRKKGRKRH